MEDLLLAIVADPQDEDRWLVLADYLEEHHDPRRAELLRLHRRLLATCCEPDAHPERAAWQARVVSLLAEGVKPCVPQKTVRLGRSVEMTFNFIPPGAFLMGSPEDEEGRQPDEVLHRVTLTRGFWLGVHPVTQAQWKWVLRRRPSDCTGDDLPVERVSWDDCQEFCRRLSEKTRRRFRLPTESEWEYACRAGTTTPFHFGGVIRTHSANFNGRTPYGGGPTGTCRKKTTPVCRFPANPWGLRDMHGNVSEWCQDRYEEYRVREARDPQGGRTGTSRILRGGSFGSDPADCRSACRDWHDPRCLGCDIGCRVVLCPDDRVP